MDKLDKESEMSCGTVEKLYIETKTQHMVKSITVSKGYVAKFIIESSGEYVCDSDEYELKIVKDKVLLRLKRLIDTKEIIKSEDEEKDG